MGAMLSYRILNKEDKKFKIIEKQVNIESTDVFYMVIVVLETMQIWC